MHKEYTKDKVVDIKSVYYILNKVIKGESLTEDERFLIYRFKDKLTDSEKFEFTVNREFSRLQLKNEKDTIEYLINNRKTIKLSMGFELLPVSVTNWKLVNEEGDYLVDLDTKLARRIAYDINVAVGIKASKT